jgi:hypothetical protein
MCPEHDQIVTSGAFRLKAKHQSHLFFEGVLAVFRKGEAPSISQLFLWFHSILVPSR